MMTPKHRKDPPDPAPEEEPRDQEQGAFDLISLDDFYDLLMEQQEQM